MPLPSISKFHQKKHLDADIVPYIHSDVNISLQKAREPARNKISAIIFYALALPNSNAGRAGARPLLAHMFRGF